MKLVGLITEYNPFHNGHQYHLEKALETANADAAIVVMSGNYVQRGTPAVMPKHLRTEAALKSGAAVVLELPVCYASGSAESFALGAISLLDLLGCVDAVCFGTESGELTSLKKIAEILSDEPDRYREILQKYLKDGYSFPAARQNALLEYTGNPELSSCLSHPNNILGVEYLKALYLINSKMAPFTIKRRESNYHDTELGASYSSATAIRKLFAETDFVSLLKSQVPDSCIPLLRENYWLRYPVEANDFSLLLKYRLLTLDAADLISYVDVTQDLANRIFKNRNQFIHFEQFCDLLKTRELTYTRISRALLHILLDIRKTDLSEYRENNFHGYAHILGFRKDCTDVLSIMKKKSAIPLLTKLTAVSELDDFAKKMLTQDISASDLYESVVTNKFNTPFINEYEHQIIRV